MSILPKAIGEWINQFFITAMKKLPLRHAHRFLYLLYTHPEIGDSWGYSIRPITYYEPIPDYRDLKPDKIWIRRLTDTVNWDLSQQATLLYDLHRFSLEIQKLHSSGKFDFHNSFYPRLDAAIYYCITRYLMPAKVIEVGSGYSTQILYQASLMNCAEGKSTEIICVEPYPEARLTEIGLQFTLIQEKLENLDPDFFEQLAPGDILFIDSTHTIKYNSDVCRLILEILPRLQPGVWIHFHDLWFPYDYPYEWIFDERRSWGEQYFLEAFLSYNVHFKVRFCNNLMAVDFPDAMKNLWSEGVDWDSSHRSSSVWLERI